MLCATQDATDGHRLNNLTYTMYSQGGNQAMKKRKLSWLTADLGQGWGMWKKVAMGRG